MTINHCVAIKEYDAASYLILFQVLKSKVQLFYMSYQIVPRQLFYMSYQIFPRFLYVLPNFSTFSICLPKFFHVFYMSYLLNANNRNTRTMCEIGSKLTIGVVLVSLLLTLCVFATLFYCFYC